MPNSIMTSGIIGKSYVSRALITHNFDNKSLVRGTNGNLWAVFRENTVLNPIVVYLSTDSGFTWMKVWNGNLTSSSNRRAGVAGLNTNGPHITLQLFEHLNRIVIWHAYYAIAEARYDVEPILLDITVPESPIEITSGTLTAITLDADQMAMDAPYNQKTIYLSYLNFNNFVIKQYRPLYQTAAEATKTHTGSYFNIFSGIAHKDGYVDYAILANTGTGAYKIVHFRYTESSQTFTSDHDVSVFAGAYDATDISIARDGYGTLMISWGRFNSTGTDINIYYSYSLDDGITWSVETQIIRSLAHAAYTDAITGQKTTRSSIIGGLAGFLIAYTNLTEGAVVKTFVRNIITTDGISYAHDDSDGDIDEHMIGTNHVRDEDDVVGLRWFQPPGGVLLDLSDPGLVRVAYQIGEGNSETINDSKPIRICQELLNTSAYPFEPNEGEYTTDTVNDHQLLVNVNILGGPSENIDYYSAGLTGPLTDRHMSAFIKAGTFAQLFKYTPIPESEMDDKMAYGSPVEYSSRVILDPNTYEAPLAYSNENFNRYIERDIRKVYLPPDFHLSREYIINAGNFLKRTIWTIYFDGNEYEISQVVPFFIKSQIAYYSANAYVIGPSFNPFTKRTLPSET